MSFLVHWLVVAIALWVAAYLVPGVRFSSNAALILAALVLGLVNALIRPILFFLTLPLTIVTLGLFIFVLNGLAFGLAAAVVPGFTVTSLWNAILGALVVSVVSWIISSVLS